MYATNQHSPMYGMNPSAYHWNHPLRVSSHDRITVSSHINDSHWYTDSVLCHPAPTVSSHHIKSEPVSPNGSPLLEKSLNNASIFPPTQIIAPRSVIPSKRAAQNRAAQRAFRQRKERYVKDLERKAELMDEWKAELDQLRYQNQELRENTLRLEKQIHHQHYINTGDKLISPISSPSITSKNIPAPVVSVVDKQNKRSKSTKEDLPPNICTTFLPVNLRAHDHKVVYGSPTTSCSSSSSIGLEEAKLHYNHQMSWNSTTGSDFDRYETNLTFVSTNNDNQSSDNLCEVLRSRQRSEINSPYVSMQNQQQQQNYVMQLSSPMVRSDSNNNMLMSRTY